MSVCYIVGAGDFEVPFSPTADDLIIAADGGLRHLLAHGIRCDLLLGDFDSLEEIPDGYERITFPVEKDYTDMALALYEGEKRGYKKFVILGGTGGREDHTFANYCLLLEAKNRGLQAKIVSKNNTAFIVKNEKANVKCNTGCHFSAFAFGSKAFGVSISGLQYEAKNIDLDPSCHIAVSNIFDGRTGEISVKEGALLVIVESSDAKISF